MLDRCGCRDKVIIEVGSFSIERYVVGKKEVGMEAGDTEIENSTGKSVCPHQLDVFKVTCYRDRCQAQKESKK